MSCKCACWIFCLYCLVFFFLFKGAFDKSKQAKDNLFFAMFIAYFVCVFLLPVLFPYKGGGMWDLSSACETDWADFTDWMFFLSSNLTEEVRPNTVAITANNWSLLSTWKRREDNDLGINALL